MLPSCQSFVRYVVLKQFLADSLSFHLLHMGFGRVKVFKFCCGPVIHFSFYDLYNTLGVIHPAQPWVAKIFFFYSFPKCFIILHFTFTSDALFCSNFCVRCEFSPVIFFILVHLFQQHSLKRLLFLHGTASAFLPSLLGICVWPVSGFSILTHPTMRIALYQSHSLWATAVRLQAFPSGRVIPPFYSSLSILFRYPRTCSV